MQGDEFPANSILGNSVGKKGAGAVRRSAPGSTYGCTFPRELPLRLPEGGGAVEARRFRGQQKAGAQALERGRAQDFPDKQRKRRRLLGNSENGCKRKRAEYRGHVWSYDFVIDRTEDGRRLKMMPIVDEYSRECLSIEVHRSISAEDVVRILAALFEQRGEPSFMRSDNGPEFIAGAVKQWLEVSGVKTLYIEPGSPWENAYSETFISRLGDELLKREEFTSLLEAKVLVEEYRNHYNRERPHSALGYRTPAEFAASCEVTVEDEDLTKELESITVLS